MTTTKILSSYQNGNTFVEIYEDGTKIREYEGVPSPIFPESIDVKITNFCDLECKYCHENSSRTGIHGNLSKLLETIKCLPSGVELAIGGGNPLSHPYLILFLKALKYESLIANITVNQLHLKKYRELLEYLITENLVKGVGISIVNDNFSPILPLLKLTNNIVYHVIVGINDIGVLDKLIKLKNCKVLILGYKEWGRGIEYFGEPIKKSIREWYRYIANYLGKCVLSFDNLAIEQLNLQRLFTKEGWNQFYMGDDFSFTMYIDGVRQEFSETSRSKERVGFEEMSLLNYFGRNKCVIKKK